MIEPNLDEEETLATIRRSAGSQSIDLLKQSIEWSGWTSDVLSTAGSEDGKTALIMAAWKGCIDNVRYLVEDCCVDLDVYSKAKYAYGKTALFFALTQSRRDVVEYLLFKTPSSRVPKVTIVNNKSQSILSLAASHDMPNHILDRIRSLEDHQQQEDDWWNFRDSHSDGLEYGDLDPRFMARPLREGIDVVTEFAINPTTKTTRKNGFARRNPDVVAMELERKKQQQKQRNDAKRKKKQSEERIRTQKEEEWKNCWDELNKSADLDPYHDTLDMMVSILIQIITLGPQLRRRWIDDAVDRLFQLEQAYRRDTIDINNDVSKILLDATIEKIENETNNDIDEMMITSIDKIRVRLQCVDDKAFAKDGPGRSRIKPPNQSKLSNNNSKKVMKQQEPTTKLPLDLNLWKEVFQQVDKLSISLLESNKKGMLSCPAPPIFVDTVDELQKLQLELNMNMALSASSSLQRRFVVAIDTEWYDGGPNKKTNYLSTIQLAFCDFDKSDREIFIHTYVVDLMIQGELYYKNAQVLIRTLIHSQNLFVLGFAIGRDMSMMRKYVDCDSEGTTTTTTSSNESIILDLQRFFADAVLEQQYNRSFLPGLKTCAAHLSIIPLSKKEQCSEWGQRPLQDSQIEYAGLDAAVLLILLAEGYRQITS